MEIQTSHRFREITVVLAYSLFSETLIAEDYSFSEFYIRLTRRFSVL